LGANEVGGVVGGVQRFHRPTRFRRFRQAPLQLELVRRLKLLHLW
jgi:hypothetical protein